MTLQSYYQEGVEPLKQQGRDRLTTFRFFGMVVTFV